MTLPVWKATGALGHAAGLCTVVPPAGHAADDLFIMCVEFRASAITTLINVPSGWTLIGNITANAAVGLEAAFFYRVATSSSEPSVTLTATAAVSESCAAIISYTGARNSAPIHAFSPANNGANATMYAPGIETLLADCLVLGIVMWTNASTGPNVSSSSNSDFSSLATRLDAGTTDGAGGGIVVIEGALATPMTVQFTTITIGITPGGFSPCATIALQSADHAFPTSRMNARIVDTGV